MTRIQRTNAGVADPVRVLLELHPNWAVELDEGLLDNDVVRYRLLDTAVPDAPVELDRYRSVAELALDRTGAIPPESSRDLEVACADDA